MIRGGHFWVGLSTDRACVVVRTYMLNVNTSEPYRVKSPQYWISETDNIDSGFIQDSYGIDTMF